MEKENAFQKLLDSSPYTLREVSSVTGIKYGELDSYYKGSKNISIIHAKKIADMLEVSVSELYGFEVEKKEFKKKPIEKVTSTKVEKTEDLQMMVQPSTEENELEALKAENKLLKETLLRLIILLQ